MKKIALIHYAFPPKLGGVELVMQQHSLVLHSFGFDVQVFTGKGEQTDTAVPVTVVPEFQSIRSFNPSLQDKLLNEHIFDHDFVALRNTIREKMELLFQPFEAIIVHNMLTTHLNLAFTDAFQDYARTHTDKKYIIWVHDHNFISEEKIKDLEKLNPSDYERNLMTAIIPGATYAVISHTFQELLQKVLPFSPGQSVVIPNGIHVYQFLEIEPSIKQFAEKFHLSESFPIIAAPVNILERKNLEYSIDIIFHLKKHYPHLRYLITGQTSEHRNTKAYYTLLQQQIQKHSLEKDVIFLSHDIQKALQPSELHDIYSLSDLIFYFSKSENFGLPLLEAMLAKTPIFTSNLDVFKEIGQDFIHPIDTTVVTPEEAAEKIKAFIETNQQIKASYHARKQFNLRSILNTHLLPLLQ